MGLRGEVQLGEGNEAGRPLLGEKVGPPGQGKALDEGGCGQKIGKACRSAGAVEEGEGQGFYMRTDNVDAVVDGSLEEVKVALPDIPGESGGEWKEEGEAARAQQKK